MPKVPLILLPGLLCDSTVWKHQRRFLGDVADIIIPDLSKSATPQALLSDILREAPKQFALAGHSMGGWLALELMRNHANRVEKLCLLSITPELDSVEKSHFRKALLREVEEGHFKEIIRRLASLYYFNPSVAQQVEEMFLRNGPEAFINQQRAMMQRQDCTPILPTIRCPTLIIHGREDRVFAVPKVEKMKAEIPGAKLAIIEECGHMITLEAPAAVTVLMRFWLLEL